MDIENMKFMEVMDNMVDEFIDARDAGDNARCNHVAYKIVSKLIEAGNAVDGTILHAAGRNSIETYMNHEDRAYRKGLRGDE